MSARTQLLAQCIISTITKLCKLSTNTVLTYTGVSEKISISESQATKSNSWMTPFDRKLQATSTDADTVTQFNAQDMLMLDLENDNK